MKATTQLEVRRDMRVSVTLDMTVEEMDAILEHTKDARAWPMHTLRAVLAESLSKARQAYSSDHVLGNLA